MTGTEIKQEISGRDIKALIAKITSVPEECAFEVYVITKSDPGLKKMGFVENGADNFRKTLKNSILKILSEKYNADDADYVSADYIADEQRKYYIVPVTEKYNPFPFLKSPSVAFNKNDIKNATGVLFALHHGENHLWAYQHMWNIMIPNKSKKNLMAKLISCQEGDIFEEMTDPIMVFANKIDFLIVDECIIMSDYKLLQDHFGFQEYIRIRADRAIMAIKEKGIVANDEKLSDYIKRGNGKTKYAKKMMRIADSKVLKMKPEKLWENIHKSKRWNGKIKEENGQIVLDTYDQVEYLIDLLDERYTRSDITGEEYDTEVKQLAEPVSN